MTSPIGVNDMWNPFSADSWVDLGNKAKNYASDLGEYAAGMVGFGKDEDGDWEWNPIEHNIVSTNTKYIGDRLSDWGIVDTDAPDRAASTMETAQEEANRGLDTDLTPSYAMLGNAMGGRSLGENLDTYGSTMEGAMHGTSVAGALANQQSNASNPMNVGNYFKDRRKFVGEGTNKALLGSAGGSINANIGTQQLNQQSGKMWDSAFRDAMGDASNNINVAQNYGRGMGQMANLGQQRLDATNQPALDYLQLKNDQAMNRFAGNVALAQAEAAAQGTNRSFI